MADTCENHGRERCPSCVPTRPPTIDEAVHFLSLPTTDQYRRRCLEHWRELVGESFVAKTQHEFMKKLGGKHPSEL